MLSAIAEIPLREMLYLWSRLVEAELGQSQFGPQACNAELHAFCFIGAIPGDPRLEVPDYSMRCARALHALLDAFSSERAVRLTVGGRRFGTWVSKTPFSSRVLVGVIKTRYRPGVVASPVLAQKSHQKDYVHRKSAGIAEVGRVAAFSLA